MAKTVIVSCGTGIATSTVVAKSIEEAFSILKKYPCASGYHYFLAKDNELLSIEQYHNKLSLLDINRIYPHTNHFLHDMFKTIIPTGNSKIRLNRMKEMLEQKQDYLDILFDKKNRPNSIFNRKNDYNRTISTFVAEPLKNRIRIYTRDSRKSFIEFKIN